MYAVENGDQRMYVSKPEAMVNLTSSDAKFLSEKVAPIIDNIVCAGNQRAEKLTVKVDIGYRAGYNGYGPSALYIPTLNAHTGDSSSRA